MSDNPNPNLDRVERAYAAEHNVGRKRAKESVRQGISAIMEFHDVGYREGIRLFADKHGFDVSVEADRRRRGAVPLPELLDAGLIAVGDRLRGYTQKTGRVLARIGPGATIVIDGGHYPDPVEAVDAVGGVAYGVGAWQKWQHEPSKKTLFQLGVELVQKERQE
jgi:hypothetical protein